MRLINQHRIYVGVVGIMLAASCSLFVQSDATGNSGGAEPAAQEDTTPLDDADTSALVRIDWLQEAIKGGWTMIFLGLLSVAALAFTIERALALRVDRFAPGGLVSTLVPLAKAQQVQQIRTLCADNDSTLSRALHFVTQHSQEPYEVVSAAVSDIASRDIRSQVVRTTPLAVISSLAPLLGLLGTMIGMIEAFKLVSLYGEDGGGAMLADSIAKALITTAGGLVVAIPTLISYHFFKVRINTVAHELETKLDQLMAPLLLNRPKKAATARPAEVSSEQDPQTRKPPTTQQCKGESP